MKQHLLLLMMTTMLCVSCAVINPPTYPDKSAEMRRIIGSLRIGTNYDVDVSGMPVVKGEAAGRGLKAIMADPNVEQCKLKHLPATDIFIHTVFYDKVRGRYWVLRTGGFAGVMELYGPIDFSAKPAAAQTKETRKLSGTKLKTAIRAMWGTSRREGHSVASESGVENARQVFDSVTLEGMTPGEVHQLLGDPAVKYPRDYWYFAPFHSVPDGVEFYRFDTGFHGLQVNLHLDRSGKVAKIEKLAIQ